MLMIWFSWGQPVLTAVTECSEGNKLCSERCKDSVFAHSQKTACFGPPPVTRNQQNVVRICYFVIQTGLCLCTLVNSELRCLENHPRCKKEKTNILVNVTFLCKKETVFVVKEKWACGLKWPQNNSLPLPHWSSGDLRMCYFSPIVTSSNCEVMQQQARAEKAIN